MYQFKGLLSKWNMTFVNTLPYISNPIEEFGDYPFVSWEREIYPQFKGTVKPEEIDFFADMITSRNLKRVLDFGIGGGTELSGIIENLEKRGKSLETAEANEVDDSFIASSKTLFEKNKQNVRIHKANWLDLPDATPVYDGLFDFGYLTGNSLTYIGGGTREYTKKAQQSVVSKFAQLIEKDGYLFIDSRNYDYIKSLMNLPKKDIFDNFYFDYTVYYHGFQEKILVFPAYISDTVVVLHYYDKINKKWSKLDLYPIYQKDMIEILSRDFVIEKVYHDFKEVDPESTDKGLFVQFLARKK